MNAKWIVFPRACVAELQEHEVPQPQAGQVLVKLVISTISSGTERANITGDPTVSISSTDPVAHFPRVSGYSTSGIVEAVGEGVTGVKPGDRVAMCWTVHSEYVCVEEKQVSLLPEKLSFEEGSLAHIATFPLAAIRKCRLEIGESAIVMGQGVLGMLAVQLLHAGGAVPVIAADPVPEKRAQALALGADYALDPFDPDFAKTVKALTHGGVKVGIEVTGQCKALDNVLDCMAPFGRIALLGCTRHSDFCIDYYRKVHGPGITLVGAHTLARPKVESAANYWTDKDDREAVLRLMETGRIAVKPLIGETHAPQECPEVYTRLCNEKSFPIVQFDWRRL